MNKKYKLTDATFEFNGRTLHRIKALIDIPCFLVKPGDLGGWIESEKNLSHEGECWIDVNAKVFGDAVVSNDARVYDNAMVFGSSKVSGDAKVYGNSKVYGYAEVYGNASVSGDAWVYGDAKILHKARVCGDAKVFGHAVVNGRAEVCMNAEVYGDAEVGENAAVYGHAAVYANARIFGNTRIYGHAVIRGDADVYDNVKVCDDAQVNGHTRVCGNAIVRDGKVQKTSDLLVAGPVGSRNSYVTFNAVSGTVCTGCFKGTLDEFEKAVMKHHGDNDYGKSYARVIAMFKAVAVDAQADQDDQDGSINDKITNDEQIESPSMAKKYELTDATFEFNGRTLRRIRALTDIPGRVEAGDLGGWIESEKNLSHKGECWVYDEAEVYGDAKVYGNAKVYGYSKVYENAKVYGESMVYESANVCGNAEVHGNAEISGKAMVYGQAIVLGGAEVYDNAEVYDKAQVYGTAAVNGNAIVRDGKVQKSSDILVIGPVGSCDSYVTFNKESGTVCTISFKGNLDEFETAMKKKHGNDECGKDYADVIAMLKAGAVDTQTDSPGVSVDCHSNKPTENTTQAPVVYPVSWNRFSVRKIRQGSGTNEFTVEDCKEGRVMDMVMPYEAASKAACILEKIYKLPDPGNYKADEWLELNGHLAYTEVKRMSAKLLFRQNRLDDDYSGVLRVSSTKIWMDRITAYSSNLVLLRDEFKHWIDSRGSVLASVPMTEEDLSAFNSEYDYLKRQVGSMSCLIDRIEEEKNKVESLMSETK